MILAWDGLLAPWQRAGFAGTPEWLLAAALERLGCPGRRLLPPELEPWSAPTRMRRAPAGAAPGRGEAET